MQQQIKPFQFKFGLVQRTVYGGPYRSKPDDFYNVKMAKEIDLSYDVLIPIVDFSIPSYADLDAGVRKSLWAIAKNERVFVGCAGGIGRTGLFFGAISKLLGEADPVRYVRANYKSHAIETNQQQDFVNNYKPSLKTKLTLAIAKALALKY